MKRLLILEDDTAFATMLQTWLKKKGFEPDKAGTVTAAMKMLAKGEAYHLILSDMRLPDHDGTVLLDWLRGRGMDTPFIVMTSYAEVQNAVLSMKKGADDYIAKPIQPDILLQKIEDALDRHAGMATTPFASDIVSSATMTPCGNRPDTKGHGCEADNKNGNNADTPLYMEGESEVSRQLYRLVALVAPTPMSVLITGASGTGKEYVARRIHELSKRRGRPFFAIDCGAVPRDVAASEFFGHIKGAFTGADADKRGAFEMAGGGTLFLDEVGNLPYEVQVQLLRALQERVIRPVGGSREVKVDIRLVCATNENLQLAVAEGRFREDLYHRINEFTIVMPQLKERSADIMLFANLFRQQANKELDRHTEGFDTKAVKMIMTYPWPGNLREMRNVVKRATLMATGPMIGAEQLACSVSLTEPSSPLPLHDPHTEEQRIRQAIAVAGGNKSKAAQMLGIDRKTLYNKIERLGMDV